METSVGGDGLGLLMLMLLLLNFSHLLYVIAAISLKTRDSPVFYTVPQKSISEILSCNVSRRCPIFIILAQALPRD